ncbi:MAG TPA: NAD-dependent epimerase/dehydratase family protein [Candidatus Eremiobacteraceae bacterium]|nr:NAD-dependent epimerase/dehydratase family protein [Candidatus Eremiobacteraceae bacterium]
MTGAQGFVGRFTVAHLLASDPDAEVVGTGRSPASDSHFTHFVHYGTHLVRAALPPELVLLYDGRYRYEVADLGDRRALAELLKSFSPDIILHLASGLRDDPIEQLFRTNVEGSANLIAAIVASGTSVRRIVLGSSGAIYGLSARDRVPLDEATPCAPADCYSASKLAAEHVSRILTSEHGIPAVWARIFNIVGPGQEERHFCGKVASQVAAIQNRQIPPTIEVGDLTTTRDFIDVRDVAVALVLLGRSGMPGNAYNVASGEEIAMGRVLDLALDIAGLTGTVTIEDTYHRKTDIARVYADVSRLRDLGFVTNYDLCRSMTDLIDYYCTTIRRAKRG